MELTMLVFDIKMFSALLFWSKYPVHLHCLQPARVLSSDCRNLYATLFTDFFVKVPTPEPQHTV